MEERKRSNPLIPLCIILCVLLVIMSVACVLLWIGKVKSEKEASEYRASYEKLVEENKKAEKAEKAEKKKEEQKATEYQETYNTLLSYMIQDAAQAENIGNLTVKVWNNAIWEKDDEESDPFTKKNGAFVKDFNDALGALFADEDFSSKCAALASNQRQVKEEMKNMLTPPEGYEKAFAALEDLYNSYITLTNIVLNCNGSLDSYSADFDEADQDFMLKYNAAELYMK